MSSETLTLLVSILNRQNQKLSAASKFLPDQRSKLLTHHLIRLKQQWRQIDKLINPSLAHNRKLVVSEEVLANIYKNYYSSVQHQIAQLNEEMLATLVRLMNAILQTDPIVLEETNLVANLNTIYKSISEQSQKLNETIVNVAHKLTYPDDIIKGAGSIFENWQNLKSTIRYQLIEPLQTTILEEARTNALKQLGRMIYIYGTGANAER